MKISFIEYKIACADYKRNWRFLNNIIYKLYKKYYFHKNLSIINAKVWIISRTLATGIERMIPSNGSQRSSLEKLTEHMHSNRKELNAIFGRLLSIKEPLTINKLESIVDEHGKFVRLLNKILRDNKLVPRSFASKYMHFHCPAIPIYDGYANEKLRKICRWHDSYELFKMPKGADEEYYYFILRFWQVYKKLKEFEKSTNVGLVDCYLLW